MKHHEVIIDFNRRGLVTFVRGIFAKTREAEPSQPAAIAPTSIRTPEAHNLDTSINAAAGTGGGVTVAKERLRASR